jgi:hypothetical protein
LLTLASRELVKHPPLSIVFYVLPANLNKKEEPTSGLEPLTCSLRVIGHVLQGCAGACKYRIFRGFSFLWLAACCTVLRSRWCQSGVNRVLVFA